MLHVLLNQFDKMYTSLKYLFVSLVFVAVSRCNANYTVGFNHNNATNGNATYHTLPPHHNIITTQPTVVQPSVVIHYQHTTTTHKPTTKKTVRTTLAPIIVVAGTDKTPSILYKYSPIYTPEKNYKLNNVTRKRFDDFMRKHISYLQHNSKMQKKIQHSAAEYYFQVHTHYNRAHVRNVALANVHFGQCNDPSTSSIICLPGHSVICSPTGIIVCTAPYASLHVCDGSQNLCSNTHLPCEDSDLNCLVNLQGSRDFSVPCLAFYEIVNTNNTLRTIQAPVPQNAFLPQLPNAQNVLCASTIVEARIYRSAVRSLALLGIQLKENIIDLLDQPTTLRPPPLGAAGTGQVPTTQKVING